MKTRDITLLGLMTAVIIIMLVVPGLGFIPIGLVNATIVHIPVIILAMVKGPKLGIILGAIFGIASIINSVLRPTILSFIFINPIVSVLPRVLIGLVVGILMNFLRKKEFKYNIQYIIPAAIGSLVNTIGVLGLIYIIYAQEYIKALGNTATSAEVILGYIAIKNGLAEMILSIIIAVPIAKALDKFEKRSK